MNTQEIEAQIVSVLKAIPGQFKPNQRNSEWTKAVKLAVCVLGQKLNYAVCGCPPECDKGWLYDLCWYSVTTDRKFLLDMPLVLESEWGNWTEIKYDFEKLLVAKSKFKVMVFQAEGQNITDYYKELEQGIRTYQGGSAGEVYLLACYNDEKGEFEIKKVDGA